MSARLRLLFGLAALCVSGCLSDDTSDRCTPDDQDGVIGSVATFLVSVSDTAFAVGGVDSGSTEPNIAVQNSTQVTLTLTNTGEKAHDLTISCIPTSLPPSCNRPLSCFPTEANIGPLLPGESKTVTFKAPLVEGAYRFISDLDGDTSTDDHGTVSGLVGEFVVL